MNPLTEPRLPEFRNTWNTAARSIFWTLIAFIGWTMVSIVLALTKTTYRDEEGFRGFMMYAGIITGCFSGGLVVGYFAVRSNARRTERLRQEILSRQYLVHWRYPAAQWSKFRQFAAGREDSKMTQLRVVTGCFIGLAFVVGAFAGIVQPGHDAAGIIITVAVCGFCMLTSAIILVAGTLSDRRRRRRLQTPQDSFITTLGAHVNGKWILWGTVQNRLSNIRVEAGTNGAPACLEFIIDMGQTMQRELVLIPADKLALAHKVAEAVTQSPGAQTGGGLNKATNIMQALTAVLRDFT